MTTTESRPEATGKVSLLTLIALVVGSMVGSGVFLLDGRELPMSAGDLLVAPAGIPHGVRNTGSERLLVVAVLAPAPRRACGSLV